MPAVDEGRDMPMPSSTSALRKPSSAKLCVRLWSSIECAKSRVGHLLAGQRQAIRIAPPTSTIASSTQCRRTSTTRKMIEERRIEHDVDGRAADEVLHRVEIAQAVADAAPPFSDDVATIARSTRLPSASAVRMRDALNEAKPERIQPAEDRERADRDQGQKCQRFDAAAGQHAVIDLQHVERRGQRENAHRRAETRTRPSAGGGSPLPRRATATARRGANGFVLPAALTSAQSPNPNHLSAFSS